MENASKALIIAGAILLSILLIAVGMFIFQQAQGQINKAGNRLDQSAIETHNKQFSQYEGMQTGTQVKSLIQTIIANNRRVKEEDDGVQKEVKIQGTSADLNGKTKESEISAAVKSTKKYRIELNYENGIVTQVTIADPN
ncbi:MAG: hypothetical protein ACTTGJ_04250 [Clostridium sp.]